MPANGHTLKETGVVKSATCKTAGIKHYQCTVAGCGFETDQSYTDGNAHIWEKVFGLTWRCSVCGAEKISTSKPNSSYVEIKPSVPDTSASTTQKPTDPVTSAAPVTDPPTTVPPATEPPTSEIPDTKPSVPTTEPDSTSPDSKPTLPPKPTAPSGISDGDSAPVFDTAQISEQNGYILGIQGKSYPAPQLRAHILNRYFDLTDETGAVLTESASVATGAKLLILNANGVTVGTYTVIHQLDVDKNGKVNSSDARQVLRAAAKLDQLDDAQKLAADSNGDGKVNSSDARTILRVAANLETVESI